MKNILGFISLLILLTGCSNSKIRYSSKQKFEPKIEQVTKTESESTIIDIERNEDQAIVSADSILENLKTVNIDKPIVSIIPTKQHTASHSLQDVKNDLQSLNKLRKEMKYPGGEKAKRPLVTGVILLCIGLALEILFLLVLFGSDSMLTGANSGGDALGALFLGLLAVIGILGGIALIIVGSVLIQKGKGKRYRR